MKGGFFVFIILVVLLAIVPLIFQFARVIIGLI